MRKAAVVYTVVMVRYDWLWYVIYLTRHASHVNIEDVHQIDRCRELNKRVIYKLFEHLAEPIIRM